jgi:hypothetical protein
MLKREGHPNYKAIKKEMLALLGGSIAQDDPPATNPTPPPRRLPPGESLPPLGQEGFAMRQNTVRAEAAAPDPDFSAGGRHVPGREAHPVDGARLARSGRADGVRREICGDARDAPRRGPDQAAVARGAAPVNPCLRAAALSSACGGSGNTECGAGRAVER